MLELSGMDMIPLIREIGEKLGGTYVNNVFSVGANQLVRFRHPGGDDVWLVASPKHGCWVSEKVSTRTDTTEFTSKLRGEVERLRFSSATQAGLDRVFDIELRSGESLVHLILELMPPGNVIVTDSNGKIRLILNEVKSARRQLRRGTQYAPPPQGRLSPGSATSEAIVKVLGEEKTLGGALGRRIALPRKYVRETLARLGLQESAGADESVAAAGEIASTIKGLLLEAERSPHPCIGKTDEGRELFVVSPKSAEVEMESASVSALCDELFVESMLLETKEPPSAEENWRRENEATIAKLRALEREMSERAKSLREAAKIAGSSANLSEAVEILRGYARTGRRRTQEPGSKEAVASELFAMAKEAETKMEEAKEAADSLSRRRPPKGSPGPRPRKELNKRKGEWYERFRWFFTTSGKLAVGGRDAQSNSLLISRHLDNEDVVYHADLFGSPFFVLKRGSEQTPDEVLEVAQATVSFSSAWKTGLGSADAFWVTKEQVGTAAGSGEFLAKGSFMIRGKKNPVQHNLVQLAMGLDLQGRVVAGPEGAVSKLTRSYLVIVPQREKASDTAKRVARELKRLNEGRSPSVDDVLRALPSGGGKIVRTKTALEDKPK